MDTLCKELKSMSGFKKRHHCPSRLRHMALKYELEIHALQNQYYISQHFLKRTFKMIRNSENVSTTPNETSLKLGRINKQPDSWKIFYILMLLSLLHREKRSPN